MGIILDMEQGSPDWLRWRQGGIGSSDSATIMATNPYENDFSLYLKKIGEKADKPMRDQSDGRADPRLHGQKWEHAARDAVREATGLLLTPMCLAHEDPDLGWMLASLDGYDEMENAIAEIKCPDDIRNHLLAREGKVPEEYWPQVQHQLEVVRQGETWPRLCYASYWEPTAEVHVIWVDPDPDFIDYKLIPAERRFWGWVQGKNYPLPKGELALTPAPPGMAVGLYEQAHEMYQDWAQRKAMLEEATRLEFQAKMRLLRLMDGQAKLKIGDEAELTRSYVKGYEVNRPYSVAPRIDFRARRLR